MNINIEKLKKYFIKYKIFLLLLLICFITIVSSAYDQKMLITGKAYARVDEIIRVVDLKMLSVQNGAFETYNSRYGKDSVNMFVTLPQADSTITYEVTIENKSDKIYVISEINDEIENQNIQYTLDDYQLGEVISPKSKKTIHITFRYSASSGLENNKQTAMIYFKFVRPYAAIVSYDNSKSGSPCHDVQCALDDLYRILGGG